MSIYVDALVDALKKHRCRCYWKEGNLRLERDYGQTTFKTNLGASDMSSGESALDYLSRLIRRDHIYPINHVLKEFFGAAWDDVKMAAEDGIHPFDD